MAFVKFMRNKFFHPHTYENQKRTWIAEQNHAAEKKKQEELHKQYIKEQAIYENKNLLKHGKLTQDDKLAFMYEPPMECRKKDDKLELREVRFEWQKNAPRTGEYARNLDVADCPFGIEVRNTKCIKCGVWGHMNTDKICPLYNRGMNTEENPPDLGKEDPMSLLTSMEKGGLRMRKGAVNAVMDVHDNKYKMLEEQKLDPEVAFIANLTDKQKRKLMKKLNKSNIGVGGVAKSKTKKAKKKKKKHKTELHSSADEDVAEPPPKNKHHVRKIEKEERSAPISTYNNNSYNSDSVRYRSPDQRRRHRSPSPRSSKRHEKRSDHAQRYRSRSKSPEYTQSKESRKKSPEEIASNDQHRNQDRRRKSRHDSTHSEARHDTGRSQGYHSRSKSPDHIQSNQSRNKFPEKRSSNDQHRDHDRRSHKSRHDSTVQSDKALPKARPSTSHNKVRSKHAEELREVPRETSQKTRKRHDTVSSDSGSEKASEIKSVSEKFKRLSSGSQKKLSKTKRHDSTSHTDASDCGKKRSNKDTRNRHDTGSESEDSSSVRTKKKVCKSSKKAKSAKRKERSSSVSSTSD